MPRIVSAEDETREYQQLKLKLEILVRLFIGGADRQNAASRSQIHP